MSLRVEDVMDVRSSSSSSSSSENKKWRGLWKENVKDFQWQFAYFVRLLLLVLTRPRPSDIKRYALINNGVAEFGKQSRAAEPPGATRRLFAK